MKITNNVVLLGFLAATVAASPLKHILEMERRDAEAVVPVPQGYIKTRNGPTVDSTATRSSWKREVDADLIPTPEGYPAAHSGPTVDSTATRSSWKRKAEADADVIPTPEGYTGARSGPTIDSATTRSSWKT